MRKLVLSVLLLAPLVALGIYACDQSAPVEPELNVADQQLDGLLATHVQNRNPFLGSWRATSTVVGSEEMVAERGGIRYIMTFRSDLSHSVSVSNDTEYVVCPEPQTSCGWDGTYTYTGTTMTTVEPNHPDPEEQGEDTALYARCGSTLFFLDSSDDGDVGIRITFQRTGRGR